MKAPLKLFLKLMLIVIPVFGLAFIIIMPQYSNEYTASLRDKFARLRSINEPKIILVGGSNVVYGFDSEQLENEMKMPVINFGLHANLTPSFMGDLLKQEINNGDIIIIAPEYYHYFEEKNDYVLAWVAMENDLPLLVAAAQGGHLKDLLDAYPTYLQRAMSRYLDKIVGKAEENELTRGMFNKWGDYVVPRPARIVETGVTNSFQSELLSDFLCDYWNELNNHVVKKGAVLYMSCPPIVLEELGFDLTPLQSQLNLKLNFPVISDLSDYVYPLDYFYDTGFHLNDNGRVIRTEQLIIDLIKVGK